jgi:hypothetical protein
MYSHKVKIPCPEFPFASVYSQLKNSGKQEFKILLLDKYKIWSDDISTRLKIAEMYPETLRFFYWNPKKTHHPWHVDGDIKNVSRKSINWILKGSGKIQWSNSVNLTQINQKSHGISYDDIDKDQIVHETLESGILINTAVPHRVVLDGEERFTVTLQWNPEKNFDFSESQKRLKSVDLLE